SDVGLTTDAAGDECDVVTGRHLCIAQHVPGRGPQDRALQRMWQVRDVLGDGGKAAVVEPDLRVGEVVVVQQHEVGPAGTDQLGNFACCTCDVELDPVPAYQPGLGPVIEPDGDAVRAERRV